MKISNLTLSKYKRVFAFGCSFTNYVWPTWADIIGRQVPYYENWGSPAAGNHYIFNSIMECDSKHHFQEDDLVIVMWTSIEREDRYVKDQWLLTAPLDMYKVYGNSWVNNFASDHRGLLIRDFAYIKAVQQLLECRSCDWANFSACPLTKLDESLIKEKISTDTLHTRYVQLFTDMCNGKEISEPYAHSKDVLELYRHELANIKDSALSVVFNGEWATPPRPGGNNKHPTPMEHLMYLQKLYPTFVVDTETLEFLNSWEEVVWDPSVSFEKNFNNKVDRL